MKKKNTASSFISTGEMNAGANVEDPAKETKGHPGKKLCRGQLLLQCDAMFNVQHHVGHSNVF